jgi:3-oxoacyl-ACP reductase-like protein
MSRRFSSSFIRHWDFNYVVPGNGREIDDLDNKSELVHRIILVNLLHLLGANQG